MLNFILTIVSLVVLVIGVVALISPIPVGLILITLSLSTLVCVSPRSQILLRNLRVKYKKLNHWVLRLESKVELKFKALAAALSSTRPPE